MYFRVVWPASKHLSPFDKVHPDTQDLRQFLQLVVSMRSGHAIERKQNEEHFDRVRPEKKSGDGHERIDKSILEI